MQIGVYGSGYLGTVISACLADFGTPVSCCHPDRSRMVEMAQGNIPFFEKNLKEIIRRNVRAGRLAWRFALKRLHDGHLRLLLVFRASEQTAQHVEEEDDQHQHERGRPGELDLVIKRHAGEVVDQDRQRCCRYLHIDPVRWVLPQLPDRRTAPPTNKTASPNHK